MPVRALFVPGPVHARMHARTQESKRSRKSKGKHSCRVDLCVFPSAGRCARRSRGGPGQTHGERPIKDDCHRLCSCFKNDCTPHTLSPLFLTVISFSARRQPTKGAELLPLRCLTVQTALYFSVSSNRKCTMMAA